MAIVYLSLGSNIGDKVSYVQQALKLLTEDGNVNVVRSSALYETEPWGNKAQEWFVNAAVELKTKLSPQELLNLCLETEKKLHRTRDKDLKWQPRTIDIDILFYGNNVINEKDLIIPHQYLHQRAFVLIPLMELVPDFVHPVLNKTISELYDEIENPEEIYLYGTRL